MLEDSLLILSQMAMRSWYSSGIASNSAEPSLAVSTSMILFIDSDIVRTLCGVLIV